MSQEIVDGNLIQMPERVMRVLDEKYLIRPIHYEGMQRIEPLELPEEALREIICNSIVHRDHQGTWTQMSVYSDHIRLWNEGKLPDDLSVEKLMGKHTSQPRNPKMAEALYREDCKRLQSRWPNSTDILSRAGRRYRPHSPREIRGN